MKLGKKIFLFSIILLLIVLVSLFIVINEKNYNDIMMEYISTGVVRSCDSFEEKVRTLRRFAHENVHPVGNEENRPDTVGIDKLISGIGWCDQTSRVFMQLAKRQGITTRLIFLLNKNGSSPHTIAEAWDGERWVLVDSAYDLDFYNKKGKMASMADIKEDFNIVLENTKIKTFALYNSFWKDKECLIMYYREPIYVVTRNGARFRLLDCFPSYLRKAFILTVQEIYILKKEKNIRNFNERLFLRARSYHLSGRIEEAERLYRKILNNNTSHSLDKTRFFLALLLKENNRNIDSLNVLTDLIDRANNSSWLSFAYGMRCHIYEMLGDYENAKKDFNKFASFPDAYF